MPLASRMTTPRTLYAIVPPTGLYVREDRCQTPLEKFRTIALRPPIDLMYATAMFEAAGWRCILEDFPAEGLDFAHLERRLRTLAPSAVLLSCTTQTVDDDMRAAALAKRLDPAVLTIAKGAHFNVLDGDVMTRHPVLDVALREEIEETCGALARGAELAATPGLTWRDAGGRIVRNPSRGFTRDLDAFPFPARHLTNNARYVRPDTGEPQTTLVTNRGCPHRCTYCLANQVAGLANRYRSVENVLAEIRECVDRHGISSFLFRSDLFTQDGRWVRRLCEAILDAGLTISWACNSRVDTVDADTLRWMKRAGCWIMAFGVESGDQDALDRLAKNARVADAHRAVALCREAGIKSSVYLLMGLPWDTAESITDLIAFARDLDPDLVEFFYPYPFPGTSLHRECVERGLLAPGEIPKQSYAYPAIATAALSKEALAAYRATALRRFYLRPRKIARTLLGTRSPSELRNYVRAGLAQLRQLRQPA
jgi:anaerobic magnesium-protoporphyrin IX monomethyl ester cyclase